MTFVTLSNARLKQEKHVVKCIHADIPVLESFEKRSVFLVSIKSVLLLTAKNFVAKTRKAIAVYAMCKI
jgi:hypothetical protein